MSTARWTRLLAGIAANLAALIGVLGIATWWLDEWRLTSFGPDLVPMAPLTAILFVILGLALAVRVYWPDARASRSVGAGGAASTLLVALLLLAQWWRFFPLPWDGWLVTEAARASAVPVGQVSPLTAAAFLLSALALLIRCTRLEHYVVLRWVSPGAAGVGLLTATVVLLSYAAGTPLFYGGETVPMALLTAVAFLALNSGLLLFGTVDELLRDWRDRSSVSGMEKSGRATAIALLAAGVAAAVFIALTGFYYLRSKQAIALEMSHEQLEAIVSLKTEQISDWRRERLGEARFLLRTPAVAEDTAALVARPGDKQARSRVLGWVETIKGGVRYESVLIFNAKGDLLLSAPESPAIGVRVPQGALSAALHGQDVVFSDLHREAGAPVHLELIVPIRSGRAPGVIAAIVLRLDPNQFLFPLLRGWPVKSASAESFLARREGDEVVYLSELRHRKGLALNLRQSIHEPTDPVALALRGETGVHDGRDYRGVPSLFASRRIPGSPWTLIAKIDQAEALAPARREAWLTVALTALLLLALALGGVVVWRQRHAAFLRRALLAEQEQKVLSERLALITRHANDVVLLFDENMRIVEANDRVTAVYGRTPEEMCQLTATDLRAAADDEVQAAFDRAMKAEGILLETEHRRKDGSLFPVEASARPVTIHGRRHVFSIIRDITERKAHEAEIGRLNRLYAARSQVNQSIVHATERGAFLREVCRSLVQFGGFRMAWVGWRDPVTNTVVPEAEFGDTSAYLTNIRVQTDQSPHGRGPTGTAIQEDRTFVCNDVLGDPRTEPWREAATRAGFRASIALPIRMGGEPLGALTAYAGELGVFGAQEIALLEAAAADIAFGLENLEREVRRRQADVALHASLREKEALLKEVHHRVKNNLQVIMSLLRLETGRSGEVSTRLVLKEMQGRIRSMALLHETLYRTGNFARVDLADYLRQLATQLFRVQNADQAAVRLTLDLCPVRLEIDQAIPCGLIVNELLTNSLKHGFPDGGAGEVRLLLEIDARWRVRIQVSDNGVGLPHDLEARREKSLGLQLVSDLTRQLGGELELGGGSGATFTVSFPSPRLDTVPIVITAG